MRYERLVLRFENAFAQGSNAIDCLTLGTPHGVRSRAKRKKLVDSCKKQKWSFRDLQRAVAAANGQKYSRASRPFKTVEFPDAASALSDITLKSKQWLHHHGCWFGENSQLTRANLKRLSGPQAESLRDAYEKLGRVAKEVKKARAVLKQFCGA